MHSVTASFPLQGRRCLAKSPSSAYLSDPALYRQDTSNAWNLKLQTEAWSIQMGAQRATWEPEGSAWKPGPKWEPGFQMRVPRIQMSPQGSEMGARTGSNRSPKGSALQQNETTNKYGWMIPNATFLFFQSAFNQNRTPRKRP